MGNGDSKFQLSPFQETKLLNEFTVFYVRCHQDHGKGNFVKCRSVNIVAADVTALNSDVASTVAMVIDVNKDGHLSWKDFNMARENICKMSGWKIGTDKYIAAHEMFSDIWRKLQDAADENFDGIITEEEWLHCWTEIERRTPALATSESDEEGQTPPENTTGGEEGKKDKKKKPPPVIPDWLEQYILYKFNLYDRTGDGEIDVDEFEYVLSHFNIPAKDCRMAYTMFSKNGERRVNFPYFRQLAIEYYRSNDPSALGNFINGKLSFDDTIINK